MTEIASRSGGASRQPGQGIAEQRGAQRYGGLYGWTVSEVRGDLRLCLGLGLVGVWTPNQWGPRAVEILRREGGLGPVIAVAGPPPGWVFLAERNGTVLSQQELPPGVRVLDCPYQVPLPNSTHGVTPLRAVESTVGRARWTVAPKPGRPRPLLTTVVSAVNRAMRESA